MMNEAFVKTGMPAILVNMPAAQQVTTMTGQCHSAMVRSSCSLNNIGIFPDRLLKVFQLKFNRLSAGTGRLLLSSSSSLEHSDKQMCHFFRESYRQHAFL